MARINLPQAERKNPKYEMAFSVVFMTTSFFKSRDAPRLFNILFL